VAQATRRTVQRSAEAVRRLRNDTAAGHRGITAAQCLARLADRDTPPSLADTWLVRIRTGNVTAEQLIQEASQPQVHAVLFYTFRLDVKPIADFHTWVTQHFHLVHRYKQSGQELWIKV